MLLLFRTRCGVSGEVKMEIWRWELLMQVSSDACRPGCECRIAWTMIEVTQHWRMKWWATSHPRNSRFRELLLVVRTDWSC